MSKVKKKHINEAEFNKIKALQNYGLTASMVSKATNRSNATVGVVFRHKTFKDYRSRNANKVKRPAVNPSKVTANELDIIHTLQNINDTLLNVDKRLQWLEENVPVADKGNSKRRFF